MAQVLLDRGHGRLTLSSVIILECYDRDKEREQQSERVGIGYEPILTDLLFFLF